MRNRQERDWDRALGIQTTGREDETGLRNMPYEPTPYPVLERLADSGFVGSGDLLLDYGCGKGRAAIFLAARTGCAAEGVDRSGKLIAVAEANRAGCPCPERVRFIHASAEGFRLTDETAFFFFNPFSEAVLRAVLGRIAHLGPGRRLAFYYPSDDFLACLATRPGMRMTGEIGCRDLFDGDEPRERIVICETE